MTNFGDGNNNITKEIYSEIIQPDKWTKWDYQQKQYMTQKYFSYKISVFIVLLIGLEG